MTDPIADMLMRICNAITVRKAKVIMLVLKMKARIAEVLASSQSPADQAYSLVELAMTAGGDDDATALVASYRVPA